MTGFSPYMRGGMGLLLRIPSARKASKIVCHASQGSEIDVLKHHDVANPC